MNVRLNSRVMLFVCLGLGWSGEGWAKECYLDCDEDNFYSESLSTITGTSCTTVMVSSITSGSCISTNTSVKGQSSRGNDCNDSDGGIFDTKTIACYYDCDEDGAYNEPASIEHTCGGITEEQTCIDKKNSGADYKNACASDVETEGVTTTAQVAVDCNDGDENYAPGKDEQVGEGIDYNCSGNVECYTDADGDGYGDASSDAATTVMLEKKGASVDCSNPYDQLSENSDDCNDEDEFQSPDGYWIVDVDGDGWPIAAMNICEDPSDSSASYMLLNEANYGAIALYNGLWIDSTSWTYPWDIDGDGILDEAGTDCDDDDDSINPGVLAEAVGAAIDLDCSESCSAYVDADGDTYGNDDKSECLIVSDGGPGKACTYGSHENECTDSDGASSYGSANADDCDDDEALAWTDKDESCEVGSQIDNNCDDSLNDGILSTDPNATRFYKDVDDDGHGKLGDSKMLCAPSDESGDEYRATVASDCNDSDASVNPGEIEICTDNEEDGASTPDENCNGLVDEPYTIAVLDSLAMLIDLGAVANEDVTPEMVMDYVGCNWAYIDADRDGWGSEASSPEALCLCGETPPISECPAELPGIYSVCSDLFHYSSLDSSCSDGSNETCCGTLTGTGDCQVESGVAEVTAAALDYMQDLRIVYNEGFGADSTYALFSWSATDCDDDDPGIYLDVGVPERLDGKDSDCSQSIPIAEFDCDMDGYIVGDILGGLLYLGDGYAVDDTCIKGLREPVSCRRSPSSDEWISTERVCEAVALSDGSGTQTLTQWVIRTDDPRNVDLLIGGTKRNYLPVGIGDCDDLCSTRHPQRDESCDGLDNDCSQNDGASCTLEQALNGACVGTVCEDEADPDGDGAITCASDEEMVCNRWVLTQVQCDETAEIPRGDRRGYCTRSTPYEDEVDEACDGVLAARSGESYPTEVDGDQDDHYVCGPRGEYGAGDEGGEESVFVLVHFGVDSSRVGYVNAAPLLFPRAAPHGGVLPSDTALASRLLDELLWLGVDMGAASPLGDESLKPITEGFKVSNARGDYLQSDPLLELCVRAELCATAEDPVTLGWCGADTTEGITGRCAVVEMKLTKDGALEDGDGDDEVYDVEEDTGRLSLLSVSAPLVGERSGRLVWPQARIVESRRRVVEWDCFLTFGTYGCGALESPLIQRGEKFPSSLFVASTDGGVRIFDAAVQSLMDDPRWWKELGRYDQHVDVGSSVDETLLSCWGDPTVNPDLSFSVHGDVGGDCLDGDPATHRDALEGPGDVLGGLLGVQVNCDTCTDNIDNNCDGLTDCEDPACAACAVGQGISSGCAGADPESPCASSGGCSASRGVRSPWSGLGGLVFMLFAALALPLWRRGGK